MRDQSRKNQADIPINTSLNPAFGMSNIMDTHNPLLSESVYAGNSVDEHVTLEEANEYLADKELGQVNENS